MVDFRLDGHGVLVTGAAGGLGRAIADGLAELGATVHGTSRSPDAAADLTQRYGTRTPPLDMTDAAAFDEYVGELLERSPGIDLLVNNAGVNSPKPAVDVTPAEWNAILETNLTGPFFLSTAFGRAWLRAGTRAAIVNVASQAGMVAIEDRAPYGVSKAGLIQLTKALALEWAQDGIRVNAVAPTFVRTALTESTLSRPGWTEEITRRIPMGRLGEPDEVAGAVAYLLSDAASLVTGHTLVVDGGYTIH